MKPQAVVLIVSFAAVLGACGDRSEEAGAPVSEPAAPRVDSATPPAVAEAPAEAAPAMPASEPDADAAQAAIATRSAIAKAPPQATPATPGPAAAAVSPPEATPAPPAAVSSAPGTVLRAEKLYSEPAATSKVTASVAKGASVEILGKQAGWLRVKAGSQSGWIRLLSVRAGAGGLGGAGVGDVVGAATTRSDPTRVVAVAGLRGLNDEDLKQAKFNAEELARMEALSVSATQARTFAGQAGLAAVSVPDLPKPQAQQSSKWESN
ncbi:MAG TPA: SH3 domain-containing protein [Steroidobacteraceae bacterium]|nr:SH3 domain-containing protein [Steroidobacteraceae bacterium]